MIYDYSKLRGRIVEKYGSMSRFAEEIGISKNSMSKRMTGITQFSQSDVELWCRLLDIGNEEIPDFFYTKSRTM